MHLRSLVGAQLPAFAGRRRVGFAAGQSNSSFAVLDVGGVVGSECPAPSLILQRLPQAYSDALSAQVRRLTSFAARYGGGHLEAGAGQILLAKLVLRTRIVT